MLKHHSHKSQQKPSLVSEYKIHHALDCEDWGLSFSVCFWHTQLTAYIYISIKPFHINDYCAMHNRVSHT